jgi:hypothetical protein
MEEIYTISYQVLFCLFIGLFVCGFSSFVVKSFIFDYRFKKYCEYIPSADSLFAIMKPGICYRLQDIRLLVREHFNQDFLVSREYIPFLKGNLSSLLKEGKVVKVPMYYDSTGKRCVPELINRTLLKRDEITGDVVYGNLLDTLDPRYKEYTFGVEYRAISPKIKAQQKEYFNKRSIHGITVF